MDFITFAQTFGFPAACLIAVCVAVWRVARWIGINVVQPIVTKHLDTMSRMDVAVEKLTDTTDRLANRLDQMGGDIKQLTVRSPNVQIIPEKGGSGGATVDRG